MIGYVIRDEATFREACKYANQLNPPLFQLAGIRTQFSPRMLKVYKIRSYQDLCDRFKKQLRQAEIAELKARIIAESQ